MKRAIVWVLSLAGLAAVVWLLIGAPDSEHSLTTCEPVLGTDVIPVHGAVDPGAVSTCRAGQVNRLAWAVLIAMPTTVLASIAVRRWNS